MNVPKEIKSSVENDKVVKNNSFWLSLWIPFNVFCLAAPKILNLSSHKTFTKYTILMGRIFSTSMTSYYVHNLYNQINLHKSLESSKIYKQIRNKDIGLILQSTFDPKDAFNKIEEKIYVANKINEAGYTAVYQDISKISDITYLIDQLKQQNNQIKVIWLRAHGNSEKIKIGPEDQDEIGSTTLPNLSQSLQQIDKAACIVLQSCATAQQLQEEEPIAKQIAKCIPGRTIFAAHAKLYGVLNTEITELKPFTVEFHTGIDRIEVTRVYNF